jgi:hypothetical protein
MKMDYLWPEFLEEAKETTNRVSKVSPYIGLHSEAFCSQLRAERAQSRNRQHGRAVPLLTLQAAHLSSQYFGSSYLQAVNNVHNLHAISRASDCACVPVRFFSIPSYRGV